MKNQKTLYGRRQGRPLSKERKEALDKGLKKFKVDPQLLTQQENLDPNKLFNFSPQEVWFEIGFGSGEHLLELAQLNHKVAFFGAEPFVNGMSSFLKEYEKTSLDNVRVIMDDAMILAKSLSYQSLDGIYVLNPDPWPKKRHNKRRIINSKNLSIFSKILKPSGKLILSTDVPDLAEWMVSKTVNHHAFKWTAHSKKDWQTPPLGWIPTKYEQKQAKGAQRMSYFIFEKS